MKKIIYFIVLTLMNVFFITGCNSTTESLDTQATVIYTVKTESNIQAKENDVTYDSTVETSDENSSTDIEIDNQLKTELINVIDCYYYLKDLFGGRYCRSTDYYEIRNLDNEYSSKDYLFNSEIQYREFYTLDDFYAIYDEYFFRNNDTTVFSSAEITESDYEEIARLYITSKFYKNHFQGDFEDTIHTDNYISPSKHWYSNEKLLVYAGLDYMYGGINDYNYLVVNESTTDSIIVTIIRKYSEDDAHVQFSFSMGNDVWKISDVCYLD